MFGLLWETRYRGLGCRAITTGNQAVPLPSRVGVDGQSVMYSSSDNEPKSTHIDSDSDGSDARRVPSQGLYNPAVGDHCFYVGQIFRDAAQFRTDLKDHSLQKQFKYSDIFP
ncbi:hypothetical protein V6N11_017491 [Hibiscus sabdariffa]|uniref:Uncharacterized protein n=1 Tax=Hibiscus sabdariffa TaxID=183260 RepID=A0ABR2TY67_9ROSI